MLEGETHTVHIGSNLNVLPTLQDNSIDSIVTDPPYELGFMGKKWDSSGIAYSVELWKECLRVLKPGGHLLAFSGSRTYHRMVVAIEDSGFEIRDMISWISNKTFPKSHNLDGDWKGWGTALKPSVEPIVVARKPLIGTVAANVLEHSTGALNIDGSRIKGITDKELNWTPQRQHATNPLNIGGAKSGDVVSMYKENGRWPANVILDEYSSEILDEQSDASRFFYVAKASKHDRNEGLEDLPTQITGSFDGNADVDNARKIGAEPSKPNQPRQNFHPTVKPTQLMRYLVKLVTPPNGTVLDPFTGSGSTGKAAILEGFRFVGIELTEDYIPIIEGRLKFAEQQKKDNDEKDKEQLF